MKCKQTDIIAASILCTIVNKDTGALQLKVAYMKQQFKTMLANEVK